MKDFSQEQNHKSLKTLSSSDPDVLTHHFSPSSLLDGEKVKGWMLPFSYFKDRPFLGWSKHYSYIFCIGVILLLILLAPLAGCGTSTIQPTPTISTSTASIVPAGPPTLSDPLRNNSKKLQWDEVNFSFGTCGFVSGKYYLLTAPANQGIGCNTEAPQSNIGNLVYQITMTILSGVDNASAGAGPQFRINPSQNASHYKITFDVKGNWHLWIVVNDHASILPGSLAGAHCRNPCPYFHTGLNQPNVFTIRNAGNKIDVWVNGYLIDSCSDNTYTSGFLGVRLDPGTASASVAFSDLRVWQL